MDVTVLVSSFDQWRVMLKGFAYYLGRYWPDCPYPVRYMVNGQPAPVGESLYCGQSTDWISMMYEALAQVDTFGTLFMLNDYWLKWPVDTQTIDTWAVYLHRYDIAHIRLQRSDPVTQHAKGPFAPDTRLFEFADWASYRISLQAGLWQTEAFRALLKYANNPWDFETTCSGRSAGWLRTLCIDATTVPAQVNHDALFCYHNMASRGQWMGQPISDALEGQVDQFIAENP